MLPNWNETAAWTEPVFFFLFGTLICSTEYVLKDVFEPKD